MRDDILNVEQNNPGVAFLLADKIQRFKHNNAMNLRILHLKMEEIKLEHCAKNEDGSPKTEVKDGKELLVYETEEIQTQCQDKLNEFMNRSVTVEI